MWDWKRILVFSIPFILIVLGFFVCLLMRNTIRTRIRMATQLKKDPDVDEWLLVFNWSNKALYLPTIVASILAAVLMFFHNHEWLGLGGLSPGLIGGIWFGIFFLNLLIDEYEINVKVLLIVTLCVLVLTLWLTFMDWLDAFLQGFQNLGVTLNVGGYLLFATILLLVIGISWLRGLFFYVAITPNYLGIQGGPTESGEQISREDYNTRVDTSDFLERMLGFGKLVITFKDHTRLPLVLLVGRIGRKARQLESIRATLVVDRDQRKSVPPPSDNGTTA